MSLLASPAPGSVARERALLLLAGAAAAAVLPALVRRARRRGLLPATAAAAGTDEGRSTTSSAGGGAGAYETRKAVDEYLQVFASFTAVPRHTLVNQGQGAWYRAA